MVTMAERVTVGPEGINRARMIAERVARARRIMRERGIPAMLITGSPNVRYLTGFYWFEFQLRLSYCLFFAEHDPIVFAHAGSYHQVPDQMPWIKNWRIGRAWMNGVAGADAAWEEAELFAREIRHELYECGLAGEPLAIVDFDDLAEAALKAEGLKLVDGGPLLLEASRVKTRDEIDCLKVVASICENGFNKAREVLRPGVPHWKASGEIRNALAEKGAEWTQANVWSGPMTFERSMTPMGGTIRDGDIAYLGLCSTAFMGYGACLYRTYTIGRPPTEQEKEWHHRLLDRLDAVIDAIKPGNTTADAARHFPPASTWGYKDEAEILTVEIGHGIGIVSLGSTSAHYNPPVINRQWSLKHPQTFEPGMVIAVEGLEGKHRVGGVRLEDMVVVTERGAELIDHTPRNEILVAA